MKTRSLVSAALIMLSCTLGWLAASGRLDEALAQQKQPTKPAADPFPIKVDRDHYPRPEYRYPKGPGRRTCHRGRGK